MEKFDDLSEETFEKYGHKTVDESYELLRLIKDNGLLAMQPFQQLAGVISTINLVILRKFKIDAPDTEVERAFNITIRSLMEWTDIHIPYELGNEFFVEFAKLALDKALDFTDQNEKQEASLQAACIICLHLGYRFFKDPKLRDRELANLTKLTDDLNLVTTELLQQHANAD